MSNEQKQKLREYYKKYYAIKTATNAKNIMIMIIIFSWAKPQHYDGKK